MFKFDAKTTAVVEFIAKYARDTGINIYFVGGMVRDSLMGIEIKDIDILIESSAIDFVQGLALESANNKEFDVKIKSVHKDFNTAKTVINDIDIDFASTREEEYPYSGCLPVVKNIGCNVNKDLKRRDFTVNAICTRISIDKNGLNYELIDPYSGKNDINVGILRVLHKQSYIDDPTRILRGLDFNLRFGFEFSANDNKLIEDYLKNPDRTGLSIDRVKLTLRKLFSSLNRAKAAYENILEKKYYKIWYDKPNFSKDWAQRLVQAVEIFNISSETIFLEAIFNTQKYLSAPVCKNLSNYEIYTFFKNFKDIDLALCYGISGDKKAVFFYKNLKNIKPDITGEELINAGFEQGKQIGIELEKHLKEKLNALPGFAP